MQINVVQMSVPTRGQWTRYIGRHVVVEVSFHLLRPQTEPRMPLNHLYTSAPCDYAKLVRADVFWPEDRGKAFLDCRRRNDKHYHHDDRRKYHHPTPPKPRQV